MKKQIERFKKSILALALSTTMIFSNVGVVAAEESTEQATTEQTSIEAENTQQETTEQTSSEAENTQQETTEQTSSEAENTQQETTEQTSSEAENTQQETTEQTSSEAENTQQETTEQTSSEAENTQQETTEQTSSEAENTQQETTEQTSSEAENTQQETTEQTSSEAENTQQAITDTEIFEEEQIAPLAATYAIPNKTINAGSITKKSGETGFYQRLPRLMAKCPRCGEVVIEYVPDYYTGEYTLSNPGVLTDCSFGTGSYKGGAEAGDDKYIGLPAAEFNYKAAKGGTTTVTLNVYYSYNAAPETGYCDFCGKYLTYSGNYNEYVDTITFSVTVKQTYFTVTYTDGVAGQIIFPDKVFEEVSKDSKTPAFGENPTREGYTFMGWAPAIATYVTEDVTYVATWQKNEKTFTLKYDANGGKNAPETQTAKAKADKYTFTISEQEPTKEGYTFKGWSTSKDGNVQYQPGGSIDVTGTTTLYAVWQKNEKTFTLKYDANGGENAPETQTAKARADKYTFTISEQEPTKEGYTFKGWSTSKDGNVQYQPGGSIDVTGTTTLYAVWQKNEKTFTLKYDANGGENAPETQTAKARADKYTFTISEQEPTKEGYTFKGWSTSKDGNVQYQPGGSIDVTGTTTLYAVWKEKITEVSYTVNWYEAEVEKVTFSTKVARFFGFKNAKTETTQKLIKTEKRTAEVGTTVSITENDKVCIGGYTFIEDHEKNKLSAVVVRDGSTSLCLYMSKDEEEPGTEESSTEESSTEESSTEESSTEESSTEESSTEESSTEESSTEESSTEESSTEESSTEESSTEESSTEESSTEESSTEESSTEESSTEEPGTEEVTYRVEWYDVNGKNIKKSETRSANVGQKVKVTESDKVVKGYTFDSKNPKNNLEDVVEKDGSTTLELYFKKSSERPTKPNESNSSSSDSSSSSESKSDSSSSSESESNSSSSSTINLLTVPNTDSATKCGYPMWVFWLSNNENDCIQNDSNDSIESESQTTGKIPRTGEEQRNPLPYVILVLAIAGMVVIKRRKNEL